jgi:DNA polymerase (family X)
LYSGFFFVHTLAYFHAMNNSDIADTLAYLGKLLDLHNQDPELAKSLANAAFQIDKYSSELAIMPRNNIEKARGITPAIAQYIYELLDTNQLQVLQLWIQQTPESVLQMMRIKGLGPKKLRIVWIEMGIENVSDLLYACNENRLINYKGFGEKSQQSILEATTFYLNSSGKYLYANLIYFSDQLLLYFAKLKKWNAAITGDVRRQNNIIEFVEYVIEENINTIAQNLDAQYFSEINIVENKIECISHQTKIILHCATNNNFGTILFNTSSADIFLQDFATTYSIPHVNTEQEIFTSNQLPFIPSYLREYKVQQSLSLAKNKVIQFADIKGIIHNHSTYSDGTNTLQEMADACRQSGYEYFVISDHSQYASYANGLRPEKIIQQHAEIDNMNAIMHPFKTFKSIECDILPDGTLDYNPEILNSFEIIVASIHSVMNMTQEKAMERVLKAIANPYTSILGHPTGRLLLGRAGYPLDMHIIIDACAQYNVAIELNANPRRLDLDWQWIPYAVSKNVLISINPDAHKIEGIADNQYGVLAAQKAGLLPSQNLSSFGLQKFTDFVSIQKQKRQV